MTERVPRAVLVIVGIEGSIPMRRASMCLLLAVCCLTFPCALRAQAVEDSLASPWSLNQEADSWAVPEGQEGRTALMSTGSLMGIALYGWSIPALTPHRTPQQAFEMYVAGTIASTMLPWALSTRWPVTRGVATMAGNGAVRGALHGVLLYVAAGNDDSGYWGDPLRLSSDGFLNINDTDTPAGDHRLLRYALATSFAEGALGYACARYFHLTEGDAAAIGTFGDFGMVAGDAGAQWSATPEPQRDGRYVFDGHLGQEVYFPPTTNSGRRRIAFATLAGGVTGQAAGALLASRRHYSNGGATVMRTTGLLGLWAGYAAAYGRIQNPEARRRRCVDMIAGGAAGMVIGDRLAAGRRITAWSGVKVEGATLLGGVIGIGVAAEPRHQRSPGLALATSLGGAAAGFTLPYFVLTRHAPTVRDDAAGNWHLQIEPQGLLALSGLGPAAARGTAAPLVTLSCRLP